MKNIKIVWTLTCLKNKNLWKRGNKKKHFQEYYTIWNQVTGSILVIEGEYTFTKLVAY